MKTCVFSNLVRMNRVEVSGSEIRLFMPPSFDKPVHFTSAWNQVDLDLIALCIKPEDTREVINCGEELIRCDAM